MSGYSLLQKSPPKSQATSDMPKRKMKDRTIELNPGQGVTLTRNVIHRIRVPQKTLMLMLENKGIIPTGD